MRSRPGRLPPLGLRDRLVLVPVELVRLGKKALLVAAAMILLGGLGTNGYSLAGVRTVGIVSAALVLGTFLLAAILGPALLPWLPGRAFSLKGAVLGNDLHGLDHLHLAKRRPARDADRLAPSRSEAQPLASPSGWWASSSREGADVRYLENAVTLEIDASLCNGCALCTRVCPHGVFVFAAKRAVLADRGACIGCGACARNCEPGAIRVRAGTGCAAALLGSVLYGTDPAEASCGCADSSDCC